MSGASWLEPGEVFKFDGESSLICPMCHVFIAKNHSWAVRLPKPMMPRTLDGRHSQDTGQAYYYHGGPIRMMKKWFVHERCWPKYLALGKCPLSFEGAIADMGIRQFATFGEIHRMAMS